MNIINFKNVAKSLVSLKVISLNLILTMTISCSSSQDSTQIIDEFIDILNETSSENNLVVELVRNDAYLELNFENGQKHSISQGIASYIEKNYALKLNFIDGRAVELPALNTLIEATFLEESGSNVPLSKKFKVDVPFAGQLLWKTFGRNGEASDIKSVPMDVSIGLIEFYVHGIYREGTTNIQLEYTNSNGVIRWTQLFTAESGDINQSLTEIDFTTLNYSNNSETRLFLGAHRSNNFPWMIDQFGDIRWTINDALGLYGLQQTGSGKVIAVAKSEIVIAELSGEVRRYEIPSVYGPIHHDIVPLSDTQYLLTVNSPDGDTIEDYIILFDIETLSVLKEWDLRESVPKMNLLINDEIDWFHVNAIAFDERDQSLLISGQRSAVVKVSWDNELEWILTDPARVTYSNLQGIRGAEGKSPDEMTLTEISGDVVTWGQHDIRISNDGSYYLFDNGFGRSYSSGVTYSRGINFTVDQEEHSYEIVRSFGEQRQELYSPIISGIDFNSSGSVLVNFGSIGYGISYDPESRSMKCSNDNGCFKDVYPGYGSALIEYDYQNRLLTEVFVSYRDDNGNDSGIFRARYGTLNN